MMTVDEKKIIQLLLVRCSQYDGIITKVYCSDPKTLKETFEYGIKVLNNCRGTNGCILDEKTLIFHTGSEVQFLVSDNCEGCNGCDGENEKEAEVQDAFEDLLKNMGKGEK